MRRISIRSILALALSTALLVAAAPAQATHANPGTLKVHDNETENPDVRNVPHVSCDFWLEAFGMSDDEIAIRFFAWPPTGDMSEVQPLKGELTATADSGESSGEFHFLAGPFELPPGHYRVEIYTDDGHPGGNPEHMAKAKTFWVEACDVPTENPPCPPGLIAAAVGSSGVNLTWSAVADVDAYAVYRAEGEGDFELIALVEGTAHLDEDVAPGVTYSYYVTAVVGDTESVGCEDVSVTLVPFFPGMLVGALALVGGVAAYATLRRR